jgi:transposase
VKIAALSIDLAKSIFQLYGVDERGAVVLRRQLTRKQLLPLVAKLPSCLIGLEACAGAYYWARELGQFGHTVG